MAQKRVLIIDNDSRNIFALTATLRAKSHDCLSCLNTQDALELVQTDEKSRCHLAGYDDVGH